MRAEDEKVIAVAWLHDVLEDTSVTKEQLAMAGIPGDVVATVVSLTNTGEPYDDYLEWIKGIPMARKVKIADMLHNLSDDPTEKQIWKYANGLVRLLAP